MVAGRRHLALACTLGSAHSSWGKVVLLALGDTKHSIKLQPPLSQTLVIVLKFEEENHLKR